MRKAVGAGDMSARYILIELDGGWDCRVELLRNSEGGVDAKGEVRHEGARRCVLVTLNQSTAEIAEEKLAERARAYVSRHGALPP